MYMSSRISGGRNTANKGEVRKANPETSSVAFFPGRPCPQYCVRTSSCRNTLVGQSSADVPAWKHQDTASPPSEISRRPAPPSKDVGSFGHRSTLPYYDTTSSYAASRTDVLDETQDLDTERRLRWCLAAEAVLNYPVIKRRFRTREYTDASGQAATCLQEDQPEELLMQSPTNWSREGLLPGEFGLIMGMVLWSTSMAFGGIHAAAWDAYFPSKVESRMWRISSVYISSSGLLWYIINMLSKVSKHFGIGLCFRTRLLPGLRLLLSVVLCAERCMFLLEHIWLLRRLLVSGSCLWLRMRRRIGCSLFRIFDLMYNEYVYRSFFADMGRF